MPTNYGIKLGASQPADYKWGTLPKIVVNPSGDWTPYLPEYEPQVLPDGKDPNDCWLAGSLNKLEIQLKRLFPDQKWNLSERFPYNGLNSQPYGDDPFKAGEFLRKFGDVDEDVLPTGKTYEEFITPRPLTEELLNKAKALTSLVTIKQEYVWNDFDSPIPLAEKQRRITQCLPLDPPGVSLYAWKQDANGLYYRPAGAPDVHWCVLFKETDREYYIFDTYDHSIKKVRKDMNFAMCIRYFVHKGELPKPNLWSRIIAWFRKLYEF